MAILGGSPLGLIGVRSSAIQGTGMSSFNGGQSRNLNVSNYNLGTDKYPIQGVGNNKTDNVTINMSYGTKSLFTGQNVISPYGNLGKVGTDDGGGQGLKTDYKGINRNTLHNNDIYDTSLLNIIEKLSPTKASLRPADFAYLKDVGVFPNNRLMIARRFLSPTGDNIFGKSSTTQGAMAVMIAWKLQGDDFLEISFGEKWDDANADFTDVLNSLGKDFTIGMAGGVGSIGSMGAGVIPLPGFTEILQRRVLQSIGVLDSKGLEAPLPSGNPNLIKEAKRRKTIGFSDHGSGLKCTVNVKMTCEWEQKFISGIDPTIVWQDIVSTILRFSTSNSDTYGLSKEFEKKIETWVNEPKNIVKDMTKYITDALTDAKDEITKALNSIIDTANKVTDTKVTKPSADDIKRQKDASAANVTAFMKVAGEILKTQILKYKIEIEGIARALSGAPSTPWHITLGNPLRPIFCAGDMYMDSEVKMTFGPTLAFNDLPSNIIAEFTLQNARPWGLQEIMAKFNAGSIRVSAGIKSADATNGGEKVGDTKLTGGIAKGSSASNVTSASASNIKNSQPAPSVTNAAVQQNSVGPMTQAQATKNVALTDTSVSNFTNNFGVTSNLPPQAPGISDLKQPISSMMPSGLTTTGIANISVSGLSGLSTTKEGKSGEQIVADANSTLATAQEVVSKLPTFGLA